MITITEHSNRRGFSLVELMVSVLVLGLLMAGVLTSIVSLSQGSNSLINYVDMNNESRVALEYLGRDIRGAIDVETMTDSNVILTTTAPNDTTQRVQYLYESNADTLFRNELDDDNNITQSIVLLNNVEDLEIRYYNLIGGTATIPLEVKHIQVEAIMKMTSLKVDNTNHIISAQFMMRNKSVSN